VAAVTTLPVPPSAEATTTLTLGGPIFIFLRVIGYGIPIAAIAVTIDALRRPISHFKGSNARRWFWIAPQLLLLALLALVWIVRSLAEPVGGWIILLLFAVMVQQIAYLLVVVFPRHEAPVPPGDHEEPPNE
jgi:hypothetical protein